MKGPDLSPMSSPALEFVRAAAPHVLELPLDVGGHRALGAGRDVTELVFPAAGQTPGRLLVIRIAAPVVTPDSPQPSTTGFYLQTCFQGGYGWLLLYLLLVKPLSRLRRVPGYALVSIFSSTRHALIVFTGALEIGHELGSYCRSFLILL